MPLVVVPIQHGGCCCPIAHNTLHCLAQLFGSRGTWRENTILAQEISELELDADLILVAQLCGALRLLQTCAGARILFDHSRLILWIFRKYRLKEKVIPSKLI